jgi:hypothetical protein
MAGKVTGIGAVNVIFRRLVRRSTWFQLTSENQFPAAEFSFQRDKKGGVR